jgi:hypothetical protein
MENQPLQPKSVKKTYRIVTTFELDVPDENYMIVTHERNGLNIPNWVDSEESPKISNVYLKDVMKI